MERLKQFFGSFTATTLTILMIGMIIGFHISLLKTVDTFHKMGRTYETINSLSKVQATIYEANASFLRYGFKQQQRFKELNHVQDSNIQRELVTLNGLTADSDLQASNMNSLKEKYKVRQEIQATLLADPTIREKLPDEKNLQLEKAFADLLSDMSANEMSTLAKRQNSFATFGMITVFFAWGFIVLALMLGSYITGQRDANKNVLVDFIKGST